MPIVLTSDNELWRMFLRGDRERWPVTSSKSGGIPCIAGSSSIRRRGDSLPNPEGNMRPGNWTMPWWLNILPPIPTPPWRNSGRHLRSAPWQFGKPVTACRLLEKKTMLYAERDEQARARLQDELADLDPPTLQNRVSPLFMRQRTVFLTL